MTENGVLYCSCDSAFYVWHYMRWYDGEELHKPIHTVSIDERFLNTVVVLDKPWCVNTSYYCLFSQLHQDYGGLCCTT